MDRYQSDLDRIKEELADSFDEELKMELDEARFDGLLEEVPGERHMLDRRVYFRELFCLQHELVGLQDLVQSQGLRVVVLFDRSWYNRADVERVMGFCNDD